MLLIGDIMIDETDPFWIRMRERQKGFEALLVNCAAIHSFDQNHEAQPFPLIVKVSDLPENATMAHVVTAANIFPSVTQARKNGWDKPIEFGDMILTKRRIAIKVVP